MQVCVRTNAKLNGYKITMSYSHLLYTFFNLHLTIEQMFDILNIVKTSQILQIRTGIVNNYPL